MAGIKLSVFSGILPKTGKRLLPDASATAANNVELHSGELRPLQLPVIVNRPNKPMPAISIFLARNGLDDEAWFSWPYDVDVVRVPLSADVESRFVWSGDGPTLKTATYSMAVEGGGANYPATYYDLGIPPPPTAPTINVTGGVGIDTTRFYVTTFMSQWGEESAPSPASALTQGKIDGTWSLTGLDPLPVNSGICAITHLSGVSTVVAETNHWLRKGEEVIVGTATLTVASVVNATTFTVAGDYSAETTWERKAHLNTANMKRRLYRSTGLTGTIQLVHDDVGTSYDDTLSDADILGDELISGDWTQPPVGLKGVLNHPSGSMVSFVGNKLYFSPPYQPHAVVPAWTLSTDTEIVGIGVYGTEIGVGTTGPLYVASGLEPEVMALDRKQGLYPCLSKRGLISVGDGIVYPTSVGLLYAGIRGVELVTDPFFGKDEWENLYPESMIAAAAYGRIYLAYKEPTQDTRLIIIDGDMITTSDLELRELYADEGKAELYITDRAGIKRWDARNGLPLTYNWRSKEIVVPRPLNFGVAKIDYDPIIDPAVLATLEAAAAAVVNNNTLLRAAGSYKGGYNAHRYNRTYVGGSLLRQPPVIPSNNINFTLRANNRLIFSRTITSEKAFRLPAGYKADVYTLEVFAQAKIKEIRIAETPEGLREL